MKQGCPIGIPKNPDISGSNRKSSLGAAEEVHSARAKYPETKVGGGGVGGSCPSTKKIRRFVKETVLFFVEYRDLESAMGGGVVAETSKKKSVDSAINHFFVRRLKQAITFRTKRMFP